jgi:hypothetical protein
VQAVIRHQLPADRQQATAERMITLLAAAGPGDAEDPAGWPAYAALAPHVLVTAPLSDSSPAGRQLVLNTSRYLLAHGESPAARAVCEQLLDRWRRLFGPDHPDTLAAASTFTVALVSVGEAEPARALGEDTLQRSRRVFGPDHPIPLYLTQVAGIGGRQ